MKSIIFLGLLLMSFFELKGQNPKTASCQNTSFDKKVDNLIRYKVPVMDVDSLVGKTDKYLLLDTRAQEEFDVSHIKGAQCAGFKQFDIDDWKDVDKDAPIVVYCSVGYRSEKIGKKLKKAGFTQVYNLYGGLFEWVNRNYPLEFDTQKIHTYNKKWSRWVFNFSIVKTW